MKRIIATLSILFVILISGVLFYNLSNQPEDFVIFAHHENLNNGLRNELIKRLESNNIPYQVDVSGNIKIPEKELSKAVRCCS